MSMELAAVVNVGAVPPGHLTAEGHVTTLEPVESCFKTNRILHGLVGAVNTNVSSCEPKV